MLRFDDYTELQFWMLSLELAGRRSRRQRPRGERDFMSDVLLLAASATRSAGSETRIEVVDWS